MSPPVPLRLVASRDTPATQAPPLQGLRVLERGWLSSNNVLIQGREPGDGAVLVDASHCLHAEQTVSLLRRALGEEPLRCVLNTHLHSDHCGGNAAVQTAFGAPSFIPAGPWEAVQAWDETRLGFTGVGQHCERFSAQGTLVHGERLSLGGRSWQVIAAPGHDPDAVMLFDTDQGVLISGDALWQDGFGIVFPELDGVAAFDEVAEVLDQIEALPVSWVIPGHGAPFDGVAEALARARSRLAAYRAAPLRHARHAAKVLIKYHLMEEQVQSLAALHLWAGGATLLRRIWQGQGCPQASLHAWCDQILAELAAAGAVRLDQGLVHDA
jgi:glyoxylase-like metal-dependent hydrolase (beta-lactamase superfamily II)